MLAREGLAEIAPDGEAFDPREHEALMAQPTADVRRGHGARRRPGGLAAGRAGPAAGPRRRRDAAAEGGAALSFRPARLDLAARSLTGAFFCALDARRAAGALGPARADRAGGRDGRHRRRLCLLAPRDYVIEDGGLTVRRMLGAVRVDGPLRVEAVEARQLLGPRLLGSGGLFGYLGMYRADGARYAAALTARDRAVLVLGSEGGALVSPDDREALLALVNPDV